MFKVELDLSLFFDPPMEDHGEGIVISRTLELPFAPSPGLAVWSKDIYDCPEPLGFKLDDLVWDMDRQVFLAKTKLIDSGLSSYNRNGDSLTANIILQRIPLGQP